MRDSRDRDAIPKSIQLIAGRTGQEYHLRKKRKGAYWEDRYHATAVETDRHLVQCLIYIDLNMVRAGVVKHASEWSYCGYNEIQNPRQRYRLIDYEGLNHFLSFKNTDDLKDGYRRWIEGSVKEGNHFRDGEMDREHSGRWKGVCRTDEGETWREGTEPRSDRSTGSIRTS